MIKTLSRIINFEEAYERVLYDEKRGEDFIPDILCFYDTKPNKDKLIRSLKTRIDNDVYKPRDLIRMEIPKANFCIRPGARPHLIDWIAYQAITNYIGIEAEDNLLNCVYSYRYDRRKKILVHSVKQWLKFQDEFWNYFKRGYGYALITDITSYFANINLNKLRTSLLGILDKSEENEKIVNYLFNSILRIWSKTELNEGFGIPQGIIASGILGNLFLHQVDLAMYRQRGIKYLRYVDDIRILAKDERTAKIALKKLIEALRELGLDLNDKKTDILKPKEVEERLKDPKEKELGLIDPAIKSKNRSKIVGSIPTIIDVFNKNFTDNSRFVGRHLKFCINRLVRVMSLVEKKDKININKKLISNLTDLACLTNLFCKIFKSEESKQIKDGVIDFLKSENNIYDWQEMWLLDTLLRFSGYGKSNINLFARIAFDKNKNPMCRARAILLLGKFSNGHYKHELTRRFNDEENYIVKRAIIVAVQELNEAERSDFYNRVKGLTSDHNSLIEYIKSLKEPVYYIEIKEAEVQLEEEPY